MSSKLETARTALIPLCFVLAGAGEAHANAVVSATATGADSSGAAVVTGDDRPLPQYRVSLTPLALPLLNRSLLAALDSRAVVLASTRPRRSVAEIKPKTPASSAPGAPNSAQSPAAEPARSARADAPLETVDGPRQGQTGYVHFFLLRTPDGEEEVQVGVELLDGRIAWSFPEIGVGVMPFIRSGSVEVNGRAYGVEHLYGLRPFPDAEAMAALRVALPNRIAPLVEGRTPYCNPFLRTEALCLSCLGFVLEALFPGRLPGTPAMPAGFPRTRSRLYYTTDDLLLYLTGFHEIATAEARAQRIEAQRLPPYLREELWQLVEAFDLKDTASSIDTSRMKNSATKPPATGRSYTRTPAQRKRL